jgi:hypothetical protein
MHKYDLENRTGFTVSVTTDNDFTVCELKDGSTVIARSRSLDEDEALVKLRASQFASGSMIMVTTTQRDSESHIDGAVIYNTTLSKPQIYTGSSWASFTADV